MPQTPPKLGLRARVPRRIRRLGGAAWRRLPLVISESGLAYRARLWREGAPFRHSRPTDGAQTWQAAANRALLTTAEVDRAVAAVTGVGLPAHADRPKNWDFLVALGAILQRVPRSGAILDAGSTQYSRLLPWLWLYGYRRLHGIDLTYTRPIRRGSIRYQHMDLTRTTYRDGAFDAIACLSVIEHGVPLDAYVREASRLLKPGGLLVTSTDFWCEPVDTGGQEAYGVPVHIFTPAEIDAWLELAATAGLLATGPIDLACDERVVHWKRTGLSYTFLNVVLEKRAVPVG